jgi:hypothetical protein
MNAPPDVVYFAEWNLMAWKPRGILSEQTVTDVVNFVEWQEANVDVSFNRFTDTTALDAIDLRFSFVFHVALCRRLTFAALPNVKSAFLVSNRNSAHYFKLHELITDHSPLQVRVFDDRAMGASWLNVPLETLASGEIPS